MKFLDKMYIKASIAAKNAVSDFVTKEDGDTNFISMLLIIGIVVVLAASFLTLGKGVMAKITSKVNDFINGL